MTMTTKEVMVKREREDNMMEIGKISTQEHFDTFGGLLRTHPDIDCEVIVDGQDMEASFVWDSKLSFTAECEAEYKSLLESEYEALPNGNIEIFTSNYDEAERFFYSVAGYCSEKEYDRMFVWSD